MTALYPYQEEDAFRLASIKRGINASEMGSGKSAVAIRACQILRKPKILVVCPHALKKNWEREIAKWWPQAPTTILDGKRGDKHKLAESYEEGFLIVNYEYLRYKREKGEKPKPSLELYTLGKKGFDVMIVDEAHRAAGSKNKRQKSQQATGVEYLSRLVPNLFLLTGTPIQSSVVELWYLLNLIDKEKWSSFWKFVEQHAAATYNGYSYEIDAHPRNPDALKREIAPYFIRRLKEDVLADLPPKTYHRLFVALEGDQKRVYGEMEKEMYARLRAPETATCRQCGGTGGREGHADNMDVWGCDRCEGTGVEPQDDCSFCGGTGNDYSEECLQCRECLGTGKRPRTVAAPYVIAQIMRLKQICVHPCLMKDEPPDGKEWGAKLSALREMLEGSDEKFAVFSQFSRAVRLVRAYCSYLDIPSAIFYGDNVRERDAELERFMSDPTCKVFLATYGAGGEGITVTAASQVVLLDTPWLPSQVAQAVDRLHRPGQTRPVTVTELVAADTLEEEIVRLVDGREDIIRAVVGLAQKVRA